MPLDPGDLVIFDNDGVLVDSEPLANQVLADLLTMYGRPTTPDEAVERYLGKPIDAVRGAELAAVGLELPPDFEQRYESECAVGFQAGLTAVAGVAQVLDHLDELDVSRCVASSGVHSRIELTLSIVGLFDRFGGRVFSVEDVTRGKPAPDLFLFAAAKCSTPPERCLVVEDSPAGVVAAKAAGMRAVGYSALTPASRLEDAGADAIVASMDDLPAVLSSLTRA